MVSEVDTHSLLISSNARPKRIAFLIDSQGQFDAQINTVISHATTQWGGRFCGIFPLEDSSLSGEWWKALELLDPDFIYSFKPLSDEFKWRVDRHILPISVHEPRQASDSRLESFEGDEFHCKGIKTAQFVKQLSQKAQIVQLSRWQIIRFPIFCSPKILSHLSGMSN